jgi:segregation and condensation protein A
MTGAELPFEMDEAAIPADEPTLIVDVDGFEGPLDLLLTLARQQKVDLTRISILALANQYLVFIEEARRLHLELAADYLVMAAWLAYLKSRLLIPASGEPDGASAADMATALALRLRRLEAIRGAATALTTRPQLGREFFGRGLPEPVTAVKRPEWSATLYDLLSAYAVQRRKNAMARVRFAPRAVWSLAEARAALERLIGGGLDWTSLDAFLLTYAVAPAMRATVYASSFAATLEMVREGGVEVHQASSFAPIYLRKRPEGEAPANGFRAPSAAANDR